MDLQKIRIESKDRMSNYTCTVIMTYEIFENTSSDPVEYHDNHCVLHRVQLEPSEYSTLLLDVPLDESNVREHFEGLLSNHCFGFDVHTAEIV